LQTLGVLSKRGALAGIEMRLVLSMLARNFSMQLATNPESIKEVAAFTMVPSEMPVRLQLHG
jgi:cytochrome P450